MIRINVKEARKNFSHLLNEVEQGEEVIILRRGNIVAHIVPHTEKKPSQHLPSLKELRKSVKIKGLSLSQTIIKDRDEDRD